MSNNATTAAPPAYFPGHKMYETPPEGYTVQQYQHMLGVQCLEYAIHRFSQMRARQLRKINSLYNRYNGVINEAEYNYINKTYSTDNVVRFKDYRLAKNKIDLLVGEFLLRERMFKVFSLNPDAKSELLDNFYFQVGLKQVAPEIQKLRQNGVPIMDGMEPLQMDDDAIFDFLSSKRKNNVIMQLLLEKGIEQEMMFNKLASNLKDITIASECYGKVYTDAAGYTRYREIDPRDGLFEEADRDPFLMRSPYMGERRMMFPHDVYANWELTKEEMKIFKEELDFHRGNSANGAVATSRYNGYQWIANQLQVETYTLEWMAVEPIIIQEKPMPMGGIRKVEMSYDYYQRKNKQIRNEVKNGKYKIRVYPIAYLWEATRIGKSITKNIRPVPNQSRDTSNPFLCNYSYKGLIFGTHDGVRVSILNALDHISELYNLNMLAIRREINKAKGKAFAYNRAMLPPGKQIENILSRLINDGIIDLDTSTDAAQYSGGAQSMANLLKEFDLGLTQSFPQLLELKRELERTSEILVGVGGPREGRTPASMTATNAVNQIQISRTSTEYLFTMHHEFCKRVIKDFLQKIKISYGHHHPEEARRLLGDKMAMFLENTKDLFLDDWDMYVTDGRKEMEIRDMMREWFPQAVNAGELRVEDAMEAAMKESIDMAIGVLRKGREVMERQRQQEAEMASQEKQNITNAQLTAAAEEADKERKFKAFMEMLKTLLEQGKITQQAMNDYTVMAQEMMSAQPASDQMAIM